MNELRYTLLSDGSSDQALIPIINWVLETNDVRLAIRSAWADLRKLSEPPKTLEARIITSIDLYPCDVLFVHRDTENQSPKQRRLEIESALKALADPPPTIFVIPVKMMEAWLLINEMAIRKASGNPNGKSRLSMPGIHTIEAIPDPKLELYQLLRIASELKGRRLKQMNASRSVHLVAQNTRDFTPLRRLSAFQQFEKDIQTLIATKGWN